MKRWENVKTLAAIFGIGIVGFAWIGVNFTAWETLANELAWWPFGAVMTGCLLPLFAFAAWADIRADRKGSHSAGEQASK